jgi:hypothetical protein
MTDDTSIRITLWAAFADNDIAALQRMCEALDREFYNSRYTISVLNEGWSLAEFVRNPSDTDDRVTEAMRTADYVLACLTPDLREDDMISQLRRAHALGKEIIVFYYGRACDSSGRSRSPRFSTGAHDS